VLVYERIWNANNSTTAFTRLRVKRAFDVGCVAARRRNNGYANRCRRGFR